MKIGILGAVNIGDVVISDRLYQHDLDASPLFPKFEVPLLGKTFFKADDDLIQYAKKSADEALLDFASSAAPNVLSHFNITRPQCSVGMITSGDEFVKDSSQIMSAQPETLAVEMEGAAVAQVCDEYNVPFVVIRTISDKADHSAHIDFAKFLEEVACHYAEHIMVKMLRLIVSEGERESVLLAESIG